MNKFKVKKKDLVEFDLTGVAVLLKPTIYRNGGLYCCILGESPEHGIIGCGDSPEKALSEWDSNLQIHLNGAPDGDKVVVYVNEILKSIPKQTPKHVQEFYDQFYPVRKKVKKN